MSTLLSTIIILSLLSGGFCSDLLNELQYNNYTEQNEIAARPSGWLKSAQDMFAGPAGNVAVQIAKELLNRSAGNSQVLSLNLTNLLVILLLKVLIFAAGLLGAGHWSHHGRGRSFNEDSSVINDGEAHIITGFLAAQGSGIDGCLYQAACRSPTIAYEYARAAKALLNGIEKFEGNSFSNPRYNDLIVLVEKAAYDGYREVRCDLMYDCDVLM